MEQLGLFGNSTVIKKKNEYCPPDYFKFYPLYQYDRKLFKEKLRAKRKQNPPKTKKEYIKLQDETLKECYIKDECGNIKRFSDEKHIFRYKTLGQIYIAVFQELTKKVFIDLSEDFEIKEINLERLGEVIIWKNVYKKERYTYRGQTYKGQDFIMYGATIKGADNCPVGIRAIIHLRFLLALREGFCLEDALKLLRENLCQRIKNNRRQRINKKLLSERANDKKEKTNT